MWLKLAFLWSSFCLRQHSFNLPMWNKIQEVKMFICEHNRLALFTAELLKFITKLATSRNNKEGQAAFGTKVWMILAHEAVRIWRLLPNHVSWIFYQFSFPILPSLIGYIGNVDTNPKKNSTWFIEVDLSRIDISPFWEYRANENCFLWC